MSFPKVLIFGQPFNNHTGGGITLSNLFKGWPKDRIAVAYPGHGLYNVTTDVCDTYYQLGNEEHKWIFPFSLIQRKFQSGLKSFDDKISVPVNFNRTGLRHKIINNVFYPFLNWTGIFHFASKISTSAKLQEWLVTFQPDVLYLQVTTREEIKFAKELIDLLKVTSVIHMMDDWLSTISNKGLFKKYWQKKIDFEFKQLLNKTDACLSICDAMSEEYFNRYGKKFIAFHNPIESEKWLPFTKTSFSLNRKYISILYSGRIGIGITDSLIEVASAICKMETEIVIKLHIQTPIYTPEVLDKLKKFNCIVINPIADYGELPKVYSKADFMLLANDFSKEGLDFLRFSMPTKASEYMISGTPILIYAPESAAVTNFFLKNECGLCVTEQSAGAIIKGIKFLIDNEEYRKKISSNAVELAKQRFDSTAVRNAFHQIISKSAQKKYLN